MKQQNYIWRTACLLTLLSIGKIQVAAQQGLSMAGLEQMKEQRIWFHSQNAAGTALDDLQNYSDVKLNFQIPVVTFPDLRREKENALWE